MGAPASLSRRRALRTGAAAGTAAVFLAACGKGGAAPGLSGAVPGSTSTTPTVPATAPSADALAQDTTLLRTGTSLELLAADLYTRYGPKLSSAEWRGQAARFARDHRRAADAFTASTAVSKRVDKPNQYVQSNDIDPVAETLVDDTAIFRLFANFESTLAATYVSAAGTFTSASWRARVAAYASASARRVTVLTNDGNGSTDIEALYPLVDLISDKAYVLSQPKAADSSG